LDVPKVRVGSHPRLDRFFDRTAAFGRFVPSRALMIYPRGSSRGSDARLQPQAFKGKIMKLRYAALAAALWMVASVPANAVVLDLSTMTCKQFIEGGPDEIKMVLTWMDGWYKGDEDEAIIDTEVFVENAKKFGAFCAANPSISIVNAAEKILGK
jgi:acid stress chaperone HdeB